jgi:hypothetical protein
VPTAGSNASSGGDLVTVAGARIYPSPTAPPITDTLALRRRIAIALRS